MLRDVDVNHSQCHQGVTFLLAALRDGRVEGMRSRQAAAHYGPETVLKQFCQVPLVSKVQFAKRNKNLSILSTIIYNVIKRNLLTENSIQILLKKTFPSFAG